MKRELKPCGTDAAYNRHIRNDETPCEPCREAHNAYYRKWKAPGFKPHALAPCGTHAAYVRHRSKRQRPCDACKKAHAEYMATRLAVTK